MKTVHQGKLSAALLEEQDLAAAKADPEAFLQSIMDTGFSGFIIPGKHIRSVLPLLKAGFLDTLGKRFAHATFRVAIVDMPRGLTASAVKALMTAYKVGDSVFFTDSVEEALALLASVPPAG